MRESPQPLIHLEAAVLQMATLEPGETLARLLQRLEAARTDATLGRKACGEAFQRAAQFDRITRSIAFPATTLGAVEGGWTAVDPIFPSASADWVTYKLTGDHYIAALTAGGARTAFGPAPTCPGGGGSYEVRETGVAGIACSNGTGGDWDFTTGEPKPGNSAGFDVPLHAWPALRSWDGWLLLQLPTGPTPTPSPP